MNIKSGAARNKLIAAAALFLAAIVWPPAHAQVAAPVKPAADKALEKSIHLPTDAAKQIGFNWATQDSTGSQWDIQYYGTVGQGSNYVFSGGMYCQVGGSNVNAPNNMGTLSKDGDEVEIGPYTASGGVKVYRRIKIYKNEPFARWIDIYENPGKADVKVAAQVMSNFNWNITKTTGSGGGNNFGDKDIAFITETPSGGNNAPTIMQLVCDKKSKLRPTVVAQNNQTRVNWNLTLKPGQTIAIAYFVSQAATTDEQLKRLKAFQSYKMLRDLPGPARRLIANFSSDSAVYEGITLERSEQGDSVVEGTAEAITGKVANESFVLTTGPLGEVKLAADKVIGMAVCPGEAKAFRVLLSDGQILKGTLPEGEELLLKRDSGDLKIPIEKVRQWSYRISDEKPYDLPFPGATVVMRTGDRISFDPAKTKFSLHTAHGPVELSPGDLQSIRMDNTGNCVHRAYMLNGSTLAGFLEPGKITLACRLGQAVEIDRNLITSIDFVPEDRNDPILSRIILKNGDELLGDVVDAELKVVTSYSKSGEIAIKPENIQSLAFNPNSSGRIVITLWDGTIIRGRLNQPELTVEVMPGPQMKIAPSQMVSITRMQMLAPKETVKRVEQLVALLGAEAVKDRENATEELVKMGEPIVQLLQRHLNAHDLEVRQRIQGVVDRIGGKKPAPTPPTPNVIKLGG